MYLKGVFLSALARHRIPVSVLDAQAEQPAKSQRKKEKKKGGSNRKNITLLHVISILV